MVKGTIKLGFLTAVVLAGTVGVWTYYTQVSSSYRIAKLEEEKRILEEVVGRLGGERRVAEILVTDQEMVGGVKTSTLLFVEYSRDGTALPPKRFVVRGENAHVDAMVVKFEDGLVGKGDALRGPASGCSPASTATPPPPKPASRSTTRGRSRLCTAGRIRR